jgi:hypothetical protein
MRRIAVLCAVATLSTYGAVAADLVMFDDGRTLEVSAWEATGEQAVLALEGGGQIVVPLARIRSVEKRHDPTPEPEATAVEIPAEVEAWRAAAGKFAELIDGTARRHGIDPGLLAAVAAVESNFDPFAVSSKGACGIVQLIPATAARFGVENLFDAGQNLEGGAGYLRWLLDRFEGRTDLALAAYNAGERAVDRHGGIPPYPETRDYVRRVLALHPDSTRATD